MKTDLVEIFQTIRASAQPYTAMGFGAKKNSETVFELYTEKISETAPDEGVFFASLNIKEDVVEFCLFPKGFAEKISLAYLPKLMAVGNGDCFQITKLDKEQLANIEDALSIGYKAYKERGWV